MPALLTITMIWDSNITKVNASEPSGIKYEFTTSSKAESLLVGRAYTATVTLNTGYILDTVTSNNTNITISDITDNTFILTHTNSSSTSATINITSKSNVQKVSVDLTTLTGWDNVTSGEHQISVVAKATGYRDSEKSTPITFTKASAPTGETWLLKSSGMVAPSNTIDETINFTNLIGTAFTRITIESEGKGVGINYYNGSDRTGITTGEDGVTGDNATITFETAPAGALLTWLQANGTKQGGSSVSKNWKFNGTSASVPQTTYGNYVTISGEAYNDTTFVANFDYIYYDDDWSYITFGSAGFWDISQNQYGKYGGNILKFNTEPSGELLAFLQAHAQPI